MTARLPLLLAFLAGIWLGGLVGGLVVMRLNAGDRAADSTTVALTPESPPDPATVNEAAGLERQVDLLTRQLEEARIKIGRLQSARSTTLPGEAEPWVRGADRAKLAKIVLPPNPHRGQVVAYVQQILDASRDQTSYSSNDPQIAMLAQVGPAHLDVLLTCSDHRYVPAAVALAATDDQKGKVIAALARNHNLIEAVRQRGWERDAKEVLTRGLKGRPSYLPTGWIDAVAEFRDPATYPDLREYFAGGGNPAWTLKAVAGVPGIDVGEWVRYAWDKPQPVFGLRLFTAEHDRDDLAPIAAGHGIAAGLKHLFGVLATDDAREYRRESARKAIADLVNAEGTDAELVDWYQLNESRLIWDAERRRYVVGGTTQPATSPAASAPAPAPAR